MHFIGRMPARLYSKKRKFLETGFTGAANAQRADLSLSTPE
jgi:hypothetical protein